MTVEEHTDIMLSNEREFAKAINRLMKPEKIAGKILIKLNEHTEIDYCGLEESQLINMIAQIIRENA